MGFWPWFLLAIAASEVLPNKDSLKCLLGKTVWKEKRQLTERTIFSKLLSRVMDRENKKCSQLIQFLHTFMHLMT